MTSPPARPTPVAAYLALGSSALSLLAITMPWFVVDRQAVDWALDGVVGTPAVQRAASAAATSFDLYLTGYRDPLAWTSMRVLSSLAIGATACLILMRKLSGAHQRHLFAAATAAQLAAPLFWFVSFPANHALEVLTATKLEAFSKPASGLYLSMIAALVMAVATIASGKGDDAPQAAGELEHTALPENGSRLSHATGSRPFAPQCEDGPVTLAPPHPPAPPEGPVPADAYRPMPGPAHRAQSNIDEPGPKRPGGSVGPPSP